MLLSLALTGYIADFNYELTDISSKKLIKEQLFENMQREMLDLDNSICANRAHFWAYDFYRLHGINSGKIFIFFGRSIWRKDETGYMYHVAPYIVENGNEYVMEASYPEIKKPLTVEEWIENETYKRVRATDCIEITAKDKDLTEYFYDRFNLPETKAKCYIRKVPGYYWFPASIAYHELKKNEKGESVEFNPKGFEIEDVVDACTEAASTKWGRLFGMAKNKCEKYLGIKKK